MTSSVTIIELRRRVRLGYRLRRFVLRLIVGGAFAIIPIAIFLQH